MNDYQRTRLKMTIRIENLITMFDFEFAKNFKFKGERHDFWELVYVDKGEVVVQADDRTFRLATGMIAFHKPNEFHSFYAAEGTAPNIIVLTFDCRSKAMKLFENRVVRVDNKQRNLLAEIVKEGKQVFLVPFKHPLVRRDNAPVASEQMIKLHLELLMLQLLRDLESPNTERSLHSLAKEKENNVLAEIVIRFLESRIGETLTLEEISQSLHISKTRLKDEFKQQTGRSVMSYYANLKIEKAKTMIREEHMNFSQIAEAIGFNGPHYFSKAFKKATGMNPSEYARSVKARS